MARKALGEAHVVTLMPGRSRVGRKRPGQGERDGGRAVVLTGARSGQG